MGIRARDIADACERSLQRLCSDYIDIYWLQGCVELASMDSTLHALVRLVRAGKVRYLGFGNTRAWRVCHAQMLRQSTGGASLPHPPSAANRYSSSRTKITPVRLLSGALGSVNIA
jgi:aryl-alcohol dehydrogenase-like predicted oxidoreductase